MSDVSQSEFQTTVLDSDSSETSESSESDTNTTESGSETLARRSWIGPVIGWRRIMHHLHRIRFVQRKPVRNSLGFVLCVVVVLSY